MNILLLGGTGAMGSSLTSILKNRGDEVYITSRVERKSLSPNVHYILGNAHDNSLLERILKRRFDVIVDFMIYNTEEFKNRYRSILDNTEHYFFLSSARVYANHANGLITENSPRLLDICNDKEYLQTDEYALTKARQEDVLFQSPKKNWTIIRPYITYNSNRLQLGVLEKEFWLQRALNGKAIVFQKEIADRITTMTYGRDVASAISLLMGNNSAYGEAFHITGTDSIRWSEILNIYTDTLWAQKGIKARVLFEKSTKDLASCFGNYYQIKYDRLYNRQFDNSKIMSVCGREQTFIPVLDGLRKSMIEFLDNPSFLSSNLLWEAHCDGVAREKRTTSLSGLKNHLKYYIFKDFPWLGRKIRRIR